MLKEIFFFIWSRKIGRSAIVSFSNSHFESTLNPTEDIWGNFLYKQLTVNPLTLFQLKGLNWFFVGLVPKGLKKSYHKCRTGPDKAHPLWDTMSYSKNLLESTLWDAGAHVLWIDLQRPVESYCFQFCTSFSGLGRCSLNKHESFVSFL